MSVEWLFEIDENPSYYFGTKDTVFDSKTYYGKVPPVSFRGIPQIRIKSEMSSNAVSQFTFDIVDDAIAYSASNFEGKVLIVREIIDGAENKSWKFIITLAEFQYKKWTIKTKDYLSTLLDGVWPNTGLIKDIFPEAQVKTQVGKDKPYQVSEDVCVPIVFGTSYIPLESLGVSASDEVFFVLGEAGPTYTISELTTPHEQDGPTTYTSGLTYTQSTRSSIRVFIPSVTATGTELFWRVGTKRHPPLVKFSRNDTSSTTNIIDIIKYIIKDFGAVDADFDTTSWAAAVSAMTSRGLTFQRGYYKQENRASILTNLLTIARATIVQGETIEIYLDSKVSQQTITTSDILKSSKEGPGSFKYVKNVVNENDSGNIVFSEAGEPEDILVDKVVPYQDGGTTANPIKQTLSVVGVTDTQDAQKVGILHYQKLLTKKGKITFTGVSSLSARKVGDVITFSDALYGGTVIAEIDSMMHNQNTTIEIDSTVRSVTLEDWADLTPSAITTETSPTTNEITVYTKAQDYTTAKWDGTDTTTNFQADLLTAALNGDTFISGGYINTDYVKVNSTLIVGNVDWGTQVGGSGKPYDNADVTGLNTANNTDNLGSYATAVYNNWVAGGTLIAGGYIQTGTISLNRLVGDDGESVTFSDSTGMIFADGADLTLQSTADATAVLTFESSQGGGNDYDIKINTTGTTWQLAAKQTGCTIRVGDDTYTEKVHNRSTNQIYSIVKAATAYCAFDMSLTGVDLSIVSSSGTVYGSYEYTTAHFRPNHSSGLYYPDLGGSSAPYRWGDFHANTATLYGTGTSLTVYGDIDSDTASTNYIGGTNRFLGIFSQACGITYANIGYGLIGGAGYVSTQRVVIKGTGTTSGTYSIVAVDSGGNVEFSISDAGTTHCTSGIWNSSSEKKKKDIIDIEGHILPKMMQLLPKEYEYRNEKGDGRQTGFIAEDVESIFPLPVGRFVYKDEGLDTDGKKVREPSEVVEVGINYAMFIPYIVKSNSEQQAYIDALMSRVEDLENNHFKKGD